MLSCTECRERLNDLLHGDFAPEEAQLAAALSAHLEGCEQCARDVAELRAIRAELRSLKEVPAPPEVRVRVIAQLAADKAAGAAQAAGSGKVTPRPLFVLPRRYAWAGGAFAAACCLLLLVQSPNFQKPTLPDPATLESHEAPQGAVTNSTSDSARMGGAPRGAVRNGNTKPAPRPHTPQAKAAKADTPVAPQPDERVFIAKTAPRTAPHTAPRTAPPAASRPAPSTKATRITPPVPHQPLSAKSAASAKRSASAKRAATPTEPPTGAAAAFRPNAKAGGTTAEIVPFSAAPDASLAPLAGDGAHINGAGGGTASRAMAPHQGALMAPRGPRLMAAQGATLGVDLTEGQAREIKLSLTPDNNEDAAQLRVTLPETLSFADDKNRGDDKLREKSRVVWRGAARRGVALEATAEIVAVAPGERNVTLSLEKAETPGVVASNQPLQTSNLSVHVRPAPDVNVEAQAR